MILTHYRVRIRCNHAGCTAAFTEFHEIAGGLVAALDRTRDAARDAGWTVNLDTPRASRCPAHGKGLRS